MSSEERWAKAREAITAAAREVVGANSDQLEAQIDRFIALLFRLPRGAIESAYEALEILKQRTGIAEAIARRYTILPETRYAERRFMVSVLGELRVEGAFEALRDIAWSAMPKPQPRGRRGCGLSPTDEEAIIRTKAAQGIAFQRSPRSDEEALRIAVEHPVRPVRMAAIDAYMWNGGDSQERAKTIRARLPTADHPFVDRPRFHRGIPAAEFDARVAAWRRRWRGQLTMEQRR